MVFDHSGFLSPLESILGESCFSRNLIFIQIFMFIACCVFTFFFMEFSFLITNITEIPLSMQALF